jgi:hypothetical protein
MKKSVGAFYGLALAAGPALALALSPVATVAQSASANVCLVSTDIQNTEVKDAQTIVYHMRNGETWQNKLAAPCADLARGTRSYSQDILGDKICGNTQHITVLDTGQVCRLGAFSRLN